jgi:hypothetical protein
MQTLAVALIVLAALAFVLRKYLPARWRQRLGLRTNAASGCHDCAQCDGCGPDRP